MCRHNEDAAGAPMAGRMTHTRPLGDPPAALSDRVRAADGLRVCLDFDGTLAAIADDPDRVSPLPGVRPVLRRLLDRQGVSVAVVSGRGLPDVRRRVGVDGVAYAGNHGLEVMRGDTRAVHPGAAAAAERMAEVRRDLEGRLASVPGCFVEDKRLTLTVHYRRAAQERVDRVRSAVEAAVAAGDVAVEVTSGSAVLEVRPAVDWGKAEAVDLLRRVTPGDPLVVYAGDDDTDESVFRAHEDVVGVHVGDGPTAADYRVGGPDDVLALLRWLERRWRSARNPRRSAPGPGGPA